MPRTRLVLALPLAVLAASLVGCGATPTAVTHAAASTPETVAADAAPLDCRQLEAEVARATEARRAASAKQQDAWKAVVPFAVAARYASAASAVEEADKQLGALAAQSANQACGDHVR